MIEVTAAMLILAMVCVAYSGNQISAISLVKSARNRDKAVMLASQKMAELDFRVQTRGIEDLKEEEKGEIEIETEKNSDKTVTYSWRYQKKNVPPPDFGALMSAMGGSEEDGEQAPPQANLEGPMKMIMDLWGKSIMELRLEIVWMEGDQEKSYSLLTHYMASNASQQIEGMVGAMAGGAGQAAGGDQTP